MEKCTHCLKIDNYEGLHWSSSVVQLKYEVKKLDSMFQSYLGIVFPLFLIDISQDTKGRGKESHIVTYAGPYM